MSFMLHNIILKRKVLIKISHHVSCICCNKVVLLNLKSDLCNLYLNEICQEITLYHTAALDRVTHVNFALELFHTWLGQTTNVISCKCFVE